MRPVRDVAYMHVLTTADPHQQHQWGLWGAPTLAPFNGTSPGDAWIHGYLYCSIALTFLPKICNTFAIRMCNTAERAVSMDTVSIPEVSMRRPGTSHFGPVPTAPVAPARRPNASRGGVWVLSRGLQASLGQSRRSARALALAVRVATDERVRGHVTEVTQALWKSFEWSPCHPHV